MSLQNSNSSPNPNPDVNELWFAKFFIGSMVAIAFLTVVLSFLPSPSTSRTPSQAKTQALESFQNSSFKA